MFTRYSAAIASLLMALFTPLSHALTYPVKLFGGGAMSAYLDNYGHLHVTGSNKYGAIGLGDPAQLPRVLSFTEVTEPIVLGIEPCFVDLQTGTFDPAEENSFLGLLCQRNTIVGTGLNIFGEMGGGRQTEYHQFSLMLPNRTQKIDISTIIPFVKVTGSKFFTIAIGNTNQLWASGARAVDGTLYNMFGSDAQDFTDSPIVLDYLPIQVRDERLHPMAFQDASAGLLHALYLDVYGHVWGAGDNTHGELGEIPVFDAGGKPTGAVQTGGILTQIAQLPIKNAQGQYIQFQSIAAGDKHSLLIDRSGNMWVSGDNTNGAIGAGNTASVNQFTQLNITDAAGNPIYFEKAVICQHNALALSTRHRLYVTGLNADTTAGAPDGGYIGLGLQPSTNTFTFVPIRDPITQYLLQLKQIHCGHIYSMVIDQLDRLWVTGNNSFGQFGINTTVSTNTFGIILAPLP